MKKIIYGIALSLSFTTFAFAASPAGLEINAIEEATPPEFCCHTATIYVGNISYGDVTSCARTCEAAQTEWNNTREQVIKAVKERETSTGA